MYRVDEKKLDKEFEEELKKQRKAVEDAIAYDRKKSEEQSAEAKAKADKEKKDLEDAENKKKELAEKKELNARLKKEVSFFFRFRLILCINFKNLSNNQLQHQQEA